MKSSRSKRSLLAGCALTVMVSCAAAVNDSGEQYFPIQQNGKVGFIDKTGKIVISPQFDSVLSDEQDGCFSEGLAVAQIGDKWGYIDKTGKFVIPPKFKSQPSFFHEGVARVTTEDGTSGIFDSSGEFVERLKSIEIVALFSEGLAVASKGEKYGYVDKTGKFLIEPRFADADNFKEGLARVKLEETPEAKYGFVDKTGKMVIEPRFTEAESFSEGLAAVDFGDKYGYIDKTGKVVITPQFDKAFSFSEGLAKVVMFDSSGGFINKAGFIDTTGKFVISPRFEEVPGGNSLNYRGFKEGLAVVEVKNKSGYIDKTGKMIIAPQYDYGSDFRGGLASVTIGLEAETQKRHYIDKTGKVVWEQKSK